MKRRTVWTILLATASLFILATRCEYLSQPYFDKLALTLVAGDPPDVAYMDTLRAPEYIHNGLIFPLDAVLDPKELEDFYPILLANFQREGKTYAVPRDFQTVALLINQDLFDKYGLSSPANWKELVKAADLIQTGEREAGHKDFYGIGLTPNMWNWMPFLYQAGGSLLDPTGTKVTLDTKEAEDALTFYTDLRKRGLAFVPESSLSNPEQSWPYGASAEILSAFAQGKVAMILGPNIFYAMLQNPPQGDKPAFKVGIQELPKGPKAQATIGYTVGYGLFDKETAFPGSNAVTLLRFMTGPEAMDIWEKSVTYMPTRRSRAGIWIEQHPEARAFMDGVAHLRSYQPAKASFANIRTFDQKSTVIIARALGGQIEVKEALNQLQKLGDELLQ
ncbi:MAG: extracellular solute-binding protein [Chloroflexi bacterium]|nr:extracellular solute-binding protein [Chloroflexota bacterium]